MKSAIARFVFLSLAVLGLCLFPAAIASAGDASKQSNRTAPFNSGTASMAAAGIVVAGKTKRDLMEERTEKLDAAEAITKKAGSENRDLTDEESRSVDQGLEEVAQYDVEIRRMEAGEKRNQRLEELRRGNGGGGNPQRPPIPTTSTMEDRNDPVDYPDPRKYSFYRAINRILAGKELDGYEGEISQEISKRSLRDPVGFYIPMNLPMSERGYRPHERRAFDTTAGAGVITSYQMPTLVDTLRNRAKVLSMGVTTLTNLVGEVDIPKKTGNLTAYWVGEAGDVTGSSASTGSIPLRSTTLGAYTDLTRKMLNQTSFDIQIMSLMDLFITIGLAIDYALIDGSGLSNVPKGILNYDTVPLVEIGEDGGPMSWTKLVEITNRPSVENADEATMGFLTNAKVRGSMQTITKLSNTAGVSLWENNQVNGYRAEVSNQMPSNLDKGDTENVCSAGIFGDWSAMVAGFWSGVDVTVDSITLGKSGGVRIIGLQDTGACLRQPKGLVRCVDITTGEES